MKSIITLILISSFFSILNSQNTSKGLVQYGHVQSFGMGSAIGVDYNATLLFNKNKSTYTFRKDSLEGGHVREDLFIEKDEDNVFFISKISNPIGFVYHFDSKEKKFYNRDLGFRYVQEDSLKINWNIVNENKMIGKFNCKKATTNFRGRDYTAWFSTDIPLPYGPWKLHGLPGLILEAYDTNKEILFYFKSLNYPYEGKLEINKPNPNLEQKKWITLDEHKKRLISAYKRSIENGRLLVEQSNLENTENKHSMKNSYLEVFDE